MRTLIKGATVVNEGKQVVANLAISGEEIEGIYPVDQEQQPAGPFDETVEAAGCYLLPGVIDDHVHFREPGLTAKADIESESRAAAYGGVTSFFDMPNTKPQTTTVAELNNKFQLAKEKSHVNYSFFIGATNDNIAELLNVDPHRVPGIKMFMGSSTGNMLVDSDEALREVFSKVKLPIMTHCEATGIINQNMAKAKEQWGEDPSVDHHPEIRSVEACYSSTSLAVSLAKQYGARLHVAHLTTKEELSLFDSYKQEDVMKNGTAEAFPKITAEAVVAHLLFTDADYETLGSRIKCNPAVKGADHRAALCEALNNGKIAVVGTDHAPHQWQEKQGGCCKAMSGMPMLQFSLVAMLSLVDQGVLSIERLVELMSHNPALLFEVSGRGFVRKGYKADLVIVRPDSPWTLTKESIQSKCGWSPLEGKQFNWRVEHTFCNGQHIYNKGVFDENSHGQEIVFRK